MAKRISERQKCLKCGSENVSIKQRDAGASGETGMPNKPPEKPLKCNDCNHEFGYVEGKKKSD